MSQKRHKEHTKTLIIISRKENVIMEILNQRINVKAVKAYQTVEMEMTVSNATEEEIANVKAYLLEEAKSSVEELARGIEGNTPQKPVAQVQQQTFKPKQQNQAPFRANQGFQQNQYAPRMASQKQLDYLANAFGYYPERALTFEEANQLLLQFKNNK